MGQSVEVVHPIEESPQFPGHEHAGDSSDDQFLCDSGEHGLHLCAHTTQLSPAVALPCAVIGVLALSPVARVSGLLTTISITSFSPRGPPLS